MNEEPVPLSKIIFDITQENITEVLERTDDLEVLKSTLQYHLVRGTKLAFSPKLLLQKLSSENLDSLCATLKLALELTGDPSELIDVLHTYAPLQQVKLLHVLLPFTNRNALNNAQLGIPYLLNLILNAPNLLDFLIIHVIPVYIEIYGAPLISELWASKNLRLISGLYKHFDLFSSDDYWIFLQQHLGSDKNALYLLHVSLAALQLQFDAFRTDKSIIEFDAGSKKEFFRSMDALCLLIETSREKQLHLVQPSLGYLKGLQLHDTWLHLIYATLLKHPHNTIVYTTLSAFFKSSLRLPIFNEVLTAINKAECTDLLKHTFGELKKYTENLPVDDYELLLGESLGITWVPVSFWLFYTNCIKVDYANFKILEEVLRGAKRLPHKYIRRGSMQFIFAHLQSLLAKRHINLSDVLEILLEFISEDTLRHLACKLVSCDNLNINLDMSAWLVENQTNTTHKIDLLTEIINRRNVLKPDWIRKFIYVPFIKRSYSHRVLDRLTYCYCIKLHDLMQYLNYRLDVPEENFKICHCDNAPHHLIDKAENILLSESTVHQHALAFEILFYSSSTAYRNVYTHWTRKILNGNRILAILALNYVNLLMKQPHFLRLSEIMQVYEIIFATQPDEVTVKIYRNMDYVLERINDEHKPFVKLSVSHLNNMKRGELFETSVCWFVRSIVIAYKKMDATIFEFIMGELYDSCKTSDVFAFYCILYFKQMKIDLTVFPKYEYVLFGDLYAKDERAEYEVCREIYLNYYNLNPCFRAAEIRKWALEDILFDVDPDRINHITCDLIDKYKVNFKKRYFPNYLIHLHKLRIMQTLSFMLPYMSDATKSSVKSLLVESFCEESHQASVRQLMQYIMIQLLKDDANCLEFIGKSIEGTGKTHTSTLTGFIPVLYGLDLLNNNIEFSMSLVETLLPWTMGAHFKLRLYSQLVICKICEHNSTNRKFKLKYNFLHKSLESVIKSTTIIEQSIINDLNLVEYISQEKPHKNNRKLIYLISVYIPETNSLTKTEWEYYKIKNAWFKYTNENLNEPQVNLEEPPCTNIQKKVVPWRETITEIKSELLVVTSLIDSLANLGGLLRTCEVFGLKRMIVNTRKIAEDKEFQSLSMSSEKLMDLIEVKSGDLRDFILRCKEQGYKCLGAEQTAQSVSLDRYKFQEKSLILLGNERSGIPPDLLPLLDDCIEIPQFGLVRSLNVHVAGAMFIWEYIKQHTIKL